MRPYMPTCLMCHMPTNAPAIQGTLRQRDKRLQLVTNPRDRQVTRRRIARYRNGKINLHP